MILLTSSALQHEWLLSLANIGIEYTEHSWRISKHRWATNIDYTEEFYTSDLAGYMHTITLDYNESLVVTTIAESDLKWMCLTSPHYKLADIVLVRHSTFYSVMKNTKNPLMEVKSYSTQYILDLISAYIRRPY